ncbi:MAG TPA: 1-phosphofructokinase family hexose kinase [Actinomycetes bacterium]|jgi:tagatose 6-phosphate kinase|nr:1-phosphofructokinase family hexose kinase [Actinomycetes bacterium]
MLVTVTLNAALDVTYDVEALVPHATHRVLEVRTRAGGKGVNVARVLRQLGQDTVVTGLAGGHTGTLIRADLAASRLPDALVPISGESRRTLAIVSRRDGGATLLNEPGPEVRAEEWTRFRARFDHLLAAAQAVVLSGSLPVGVPTTAYAELVEAAHDHGLPALVDAEGEALRAALAAAPDVVKLNAAELRTTTGQDDPALGAEAVRRAGARDMVASLGPDGLLAMTGAGAWRAAPPAVVLGNPTGAGDATMAALADGLASDRPWPEILREAVAVSAAAVFLPVAGGFDPAAYRRFRDAVTVRPLGG